MASTAILCINGNANQPYSMSMDGMEHSDHAMNNETDNSRLTSTPTIADCCDLDYSCTMDNCASLVLPATFQFNGVPELSQVINLPQIIAISLPPASLYRPPITR